jgi:hypothetical protein
MKAEDQYLKFVKWSEEESLYVGYCPDLFPWGGVCHGRSEEDTYKELCHLVKEEIESLVAEAKSLPPPATKPTREVLVG